MACPICKSNQFYVKDASDEFEIHELELRDGRIRPADTDNDPDEISADREIFCQTCAWHGKKSAIE